MPKPAVEQRLAEVGDPRAGPDGGGAGSAFNSIGRDQAGHPSSESSVPSVAQTGVNEWPLPATRTGPEPSATIAANDASSAGRAIRAGAHLTPPDQLCHVSAIAPHHHAGSPLAAPAHDAVGAPDTVASPLGRAQTFVGSRAEKGTIRSPAVLKRVEVNAMQPHVDRTETIRSNGRPCPCGRVSVVTIREAATVNIVRNARNGAFRVVHCDEVVQGGEQGYTGGAPAHDLMADGPVLHWRHGRTEAHDRPGA